MRTIEELEQVALALRAQRLKENKPLGVFDITREESMLLKMQPLPYHAAMGLPDTFCGLRLKVI